MAWADKIAVVSKEAIVTVAMCLVSKDLATAFSCTWATSSVSWAIILATFSKEAFIARASGNSIGLHALSIAPTRAPFGIDIGALERTIGANISSITLSADCTQRFLKWVCMALTMPRADLIR